MNTKKLLIVGALSLVALAGAGLIAAAVWPMPMVVQIGPSGNILLRGTVDSVGQNSLTVKSWGGDWTVMINASTKLAPASTIGQFAVGDFVGVHGTVDQNASWTVHADVVRDWNHNYSNGQLSITGVSGSASIVVGQTGTWTINATSRNNNSLSYSVLWGDEILMMNGNQMRVPQDQAFLQTATFTHTYLQAGNYTINFYVKDTMGNTATSTLSVMVTGMVSNQAPVINSLSPSAGVIGTQVTIHGSGFAQGVSIQGFHYTVNFGNGWADATFVDSNTITFTVPAQLTGGCRPPMMCPNYLIQVTPGSYNVSVSNAYGTSNTVAFTVLGNATTY